MKLQPVLAQTVWLLITERVVSYERLSLEFNLSIEQLAAVRNELILVKKLAIDLEGKFLRWSASDIEHPTIADEQEQLTQIVGLDGQSLPDIAPIVAIAGPVTSSEEITGISALESETSDQIEEATSTDAERRSLTVMFCDLADSTALSTRLDPEDLQDIIRGYQELCTGIIGEYEGYIAKYMGDGILVYFGYPKSLERNAERAVRSAVAIIEALGDFNRSVGKANNVEVAVRIGISTGIVIVGELVGEGLAQERTVIGEAPNVAARLQGLAERNGIVIGSLTKELIGDVFRIEDLGPQTLKGITGSVPAWNVSGLKAGFTHGPHSEDADVLSLVGRDEEIGLLRRAWQNTKEEGRGQVVSIGGEAGIGKSVLVDGLKAEVRQEDCPYVVFRCSPYHSGSAHYPSIAHFTHLAGWETDDPIEVRLSKLETMLANYSIPLSESVPLLANLLSLPLPEADGRYQSLQLSPQQLKQHIQDTILTLTFEEADRKPFLHIWEDLHWADPSTLELIGLMIEQNPTSPLLIVLTSRPDFVPPWPTRSHITPITLNRLEKLHTEALISRLADDKPLPIDVVEHIATKTDGVPLYVEALTKTILASDILTENQAGFELVGPLSSLSIPETLHESLMARLDRLPQVREIAQIGSVLGREFAYEMISGLSSISDENLQEGLGQLVNAELLYQRGRPPRATYVFKHALVQDAAYESLLRRNRVQYHGQFAELLQTQFTEISQSHPAVIAHHYNEAEMPSKALPFWQQAAHKALASSAMVEAIGQLEAALAIIEQLPRSTERDERELEIQMLLGPANLATRGFAYPPLGTIYDRAQELCLALNRHHDAIKVTRGLQAFHLGGGRIAKAYDLAVDISKQIEALGDRTWRTAGSQVVGQMKFFRGEFGEALTVLEEGIAGYNAETNLIANWAGGDPGEQCHLYAAFIKWIMGRSSEAFEHCDQAIELSEALGNKFSFANTLAFVTSVHVMNCDKPKARLLAAQGVELCKEQNNTFWLNFSKALLSWAETEQRDPGVCAEEMGHAITDFRSTGAKTLATFLLTRQAECFIEAGRLMDAAAVVNDAQSLTESTGERCWTSDLLRIKGEVMAANGDATQAEISSVFHGSIELANQQGAATWALRAGISLASHTKGTDAEAKSTAKLAELCKLYRNCGGLLEFVEATKMLQSLPKRKPMLSWR